MPGLPSPPPGLPRVEPMRIQIRDALIEALGQIDGAAPYHVRVQRVYKAEPLAQNLIVPCLVIADDDEGVTERTFGRQESEVTFVVKAWCEQPDDDDAVDELDRMIADCQIRLEWTPELNMGDSHVRFRLGSVERRRGGVEDRPLSCARMKWITTYRVPKGSP